MLEFKIKFQRPLKENRTEFKTRTRIVERHTYKYRNDTIITLLGITEKEQKELKMVT